MKKKFLKHKALAGVAGIIAMGIITLSFQDSQSYFLQKIDNAELYDTIPAPKANEKKAETDKEIKELVDNAMALANEAFKKLDLEKLQKELNDLIAKVDMEKMKAELQKALKEVDMEKIRKEVELTLADAKKEWTEADKAKLKAEIEKAKVEIQKVDLKKVMEEVKRELEKAKKEMEKAKEEAKQQATI